jgi:hypothetical protein
MVEVHSAKGIVAALPFIALTACAIPSRPAQLPPRSEGYVAVLSGEMPGAISQVARHSWIVANVPGETSYRRYELGPSGGDPFSYFGDGDVALHGVVHYAPADLKRVVDCLELEEGNYHHEHPSYFPIPGPNSNTIVDVMLRRCEVHVELPATAIGRDYRGPIGASVTSLGTGVQLESWVVGVKLGLEEGVELHVASLALGVHVWPPAITVPVNPGRIGFDGTEHVESSRRRLHWRDDDSEDDGKREYGVSSMWLWSQAAHVKLPAAAGGLTDTATVGFDARVSYGDHWGYAGGIDLEGGAGFPLGFDYAARLYPVGVAYAFGASTFLGVFGGIGVDGTTARVPSAFEIPVELRLEKDITHEARVGARAGLRWFPGDEARRGGSLVSPFADELVLGTFARFGRVPPCGCGGRMGRGYFFGLERREIMHTYSLGLTFGVEVDFGG